MGKRIVVGTDIFDQFIEENGYYVDKTELIYDLVTKTRNKVSLFTRPRRFGKTLMLRMMESFFSLQKGDRRNLFEGMDILKHKEFCSEWMNQYPVLFLSFKGVEGLSFEEAYRSLQLTLSSFCISHRELLDSHLASQADKVRFTQIMDRKADQALIGDALSVIMRMMAMAYGKPVIVLIDEYDVPLARASEMDLGRNDYYPRMLDLFRGMYNGALKGNEYLKFAVLTGCLPMPKESIFTGMNNFRSYSVLEDAFSGYFGFTQAEVDRLLLEADLSEKAAQIRARYDGYLFGNTRVTCPWDVVNAAADLLWDRGATPKSYWKNTSHNEVLLTFLKRTEFDVRDKYETLMNGGTIRQRILDEVTYDPLHETEDAFWSVLLMTGYLTKAGPSGWGELAELKIPNAEILEIFEETVVRYFQQALALERSKQEKLMDALWEGDEKKASEIMTDILFDTISFHDYHENCYHAFLTGIISGLGYSVKSNQENGLGRSDIDVRDRSKRRGMILEAKKSVKEQDMEKDALEGKRQMVDRESLRGFRGYEKVVCYGISFFEKRALVKKLEF